MGSSEATIETEWILLADHAEVVNGKLYVMGGGWEYLTINQPLPVIHQCAIAVAFSVPWNETNQRHNVTIEIVDPEGNVPLHFEGDIEVGRPPGIPLGHAQRVPLAISVGLKIEQLGPHLVSTRIHGQESRSLRFNVVAGPGLAQRLGA
jgi:hypothetical protein